MASTDTGAREHERLVRRMTDDVWGAEGDPEAVDDYYSAETVYHDPDGTIEGRAAYKAFEAELRRGMPDLDGDVEFLVCEGDLVTARYTATGTHTGEMWGMAPTEKRATISGIAIYRLEDGEVVESWNEYDRLGMLQQLGLVPENPSG